MKIQGQNIKLRNIEEKDLEFLRQMINDSEISKMTVGDSNYISKKQQKEWFKNIKNENNKIRFMIDVKENAIGTVILENIDPKNKKASISIKIGNKELKNKGYGTETLKLILNYAFETLELNRIYANVLEYNEPSRKLFIKCGFKLEGVQRQAVYKNKEFYNLIMFSILKEEYKK